MPFQGGMNNSASPFARRAINLTEVKNCEFWPRVTLSSRRGFSVYLPNTPSSRALFDLALYDRMVGSTWNIELVGRAVNSTDARIYCVNLYSGHTASTQNAWATMSTAGWTRSTLGGGFFGRGNYLYYSDGNLRRVWSRPSSEFSLGLDTPVATGSGKIHYALHLTQQSRLEPGWYDWTVTAYHYGRNVESLPFGWQTPSTIKIGTGTTGLVSYYSMGEIPNFECAMHISVSSLTLDDRATQWRLYRRHPYDLYSRPAQLLDDARMVKESSMTVSTVQDRYCDSELTERLSFAGSVAPAWTSATEHLDRWWYLDPDNPNRVWCSEVDAPENVGREIFMDGKQMKPILMRAAYPGRTGESWYQIPQCAGPGKAVASFGGQLMVLCEHMTCVVVGESPATFGVELMDTAIGAVGPSHVVTPRGVFWMSQQGVVWKGPTFGCRVVTAGWVEFDDANGATRINRDLLGQSLLVYDPVREQVLVVLARYASGGNDMVLVLDVGLSTPSEPWFSYHVPTLGSGEFLTSAALSRLPNQEPRVIFGTNRGRVLCLGDSADHNGTGRCPIAMEWKGWVGQETVRSRKGDFGLWFVHNADHYAIISSSLWTRRIATVPRNVLASGTASVLCSTQTYGARLMSLGGNLIYFASRQVASSPFELHDFQTAANRALDWRK